MLTKQIKESIKESVLCWLATVDEEGCPNCSPKEIFTYINDSELVIANIASPNSIKNIISCPNVCVSFVHILKQKGYKAKGVASYLTPESKDYNELYQNISEMVGDAFPVKGLIHIKVTSVNKILAPSYFLVPGTTEQTQIENAKKAYDL